jgi:predicted HTH domain antitoxin
LFEIFDMRTLYLSIPDSVEKGDKELAMIIASKLYEDGTLSSGQAADLAGLSKRAFIEMLGKYGVSVFSKSVDDLESDIANA